MLNVIYAELHLCCVTNKPSMLNVMPPLYVNILPSQVVHLYTIEL
jgi:hypothetical protein